MGSDRVESITPQYEEVGGRNTHKLRTSDEIQRDPLLIKGQRKSDCKKHVVKRNPMEQYPTFKERINGVQIAYQVRILILIFKGDQCPQKVLCRGLATNYGIHSIQDWISITDQWSLIQILVVKHLLMIRLQ
ncbi:UNVERIFIED_CONTAM: hypothetical protein FKN15_076720 [Acipenser sinensis]